MSSNHKMPYRLYAKSSLLIEESRQKLQGSSVIKRFEFEEVATMLVFSLLYFGLSGKIQVNIERKSFERVIC